jgi:phage shock protein A
MKAQYTAAKASTQVGEAVTGLSEHMADVNLMLDRAREKTAQMQARSAAVDQLMDSGALDQIGPGGEDDIDRQLKAKVTVSAVDTQLAALKAQLGSGGAAGQLSAGTIVVRISGNDQYQLQQSDRAKLDQFDADLVAAIRAGDEQRFTDTLNRLLDWVHRAGQKLPQGDLASSDIVLPSSDMTLKEAQDLMAGEPILSGSQPG